MGLLAGYAGMSVAQYYGDRSEMAGEEARCGLAASAQMGKTKQCNQIKHVCPSVQRSNIMKKYQ